MFGNWLNRVEKHTKAQILVVVCALIWAIWNCGNDLVFNKGGTGHFLWVIHMATHWTQESSYFLPEVQRAPMDTGCNRSEKPLGLSTTWMAGGFLKEFKMPKRITLFIFC
jgi:hypothetical protein